MIISKINVSTCNMYSICFADPQYCCTWTSVGLSAESVVLPARGVVLGKVVWGDGKGKVDITLQASFSGVVVVEPWQEVRGESDQEGLAPRQEVTRCLCSCLTNGLRCLICI